MSQLHSTIDPRPALERMRRFQLERFLASRGLVFSPDAPATTLRRIATDNGLSGREPEAAEAMAPPKRQDASQEAVISHDQREHELSVLDVDELKMPQLRKLCKAMGLPQTPKDKAENLRTRIRMKMNEQNPA